MKGEKNSSIMRPEYNVLTSLSDTNCISTKDSSSNISQIAVVVIDSQHSAGNLSANNHYQKILFQTREPEKRWYIHEKQV